MYKNYLPDRLPENWKIGELDEKYGYLEFLGFDGEFLVAVTDQSNDNPSTPFNLFMSQLKEFFTDMILKSWIGLYGLNQKKKRLILLFSL